jgi:hypothetical protein
MARGLQQAAPQAAAVLPSLERFCCRR